MRLPFLKWLQLDFFGTPWYNGKCSEQYGTAQGSKETLAQGVGSAIGKIRKEIL